MNDVEQAPLTVAPDHDDFTAGALTKSGLE